MTRTPSDTLLRSVLQKPAKIACVGVSANPIRPSHFVARYLDGKGFDVLPVNPAYAGETLFGSRCVRDLGQLPEPPDILDLFRKPEAVPALVAEGLDLFPKLRCVWLQVGVVSDRAAEMCRAAEVPIIQDRCPKIEYQRLFGELRQGGFATGVISSRLPRDR